MIITPPDARMADAVRGIVKSGRMPHAFLVECEDAALAFSAAQYLSAVSLCEGDNKPCGSCRACRLLAGDNHPDVTVVESESGKKSISVSAIRELRSDAFVRAHSDGGKVFIIKDAHKMNVQAQNALLKVLEEPPTEVHFVLTVNSRARLLETVVSRCVLFSVAAENAANGDSKAAAAARQFVALLDKGSEIELLSVLAPFEKNRALADELMAELERAITEAVRQSLGNTSRLRRLTRLYSDIGEYKKQLALNVNLSLLFSAMVCRIKS